jgi:hypothetical protein
VVELDVGSNFFSLPGTITSAVISHNYESLRWLDFDIRANHDDASILSYWFGATNLYDPQQRTYYMKLVSTLMGLVNTRLVNVQSAYIKSLNICSKTTISSISSTSTSTSTSSLFSSEILPSTSLPLTSPVMETIVEDPFTDIIIKVGSFEETKQTIDIIQHVLNILREFPKNDVSIVVVGSDMLRSTLNTLYPSSVGASSVTCAVSLYNKPTIIGVQRAAGIHRTELQRREQVIQRIHEVNFKTYPFDFSFCS